MKPISYAKSAFERECGSGVSLLGVTERERTTDFRFQIVATGKCCTIGTVPKGKGRQAFEEVARQAGRWARAMTEKTSGVVH
jgi:hypothetical protein